jgi:hypothetical protein
MVGYRQLGSASCSTAVCPVRRIIAPVFMALIASCMLHAADGAGALLSQGLADAKAGHLDIAEAIFEKGRVLYPADPRFPVELAGVAYRRKELGRAKHWLLTGVKLAPGDAYANEFLGTLYQLDGNLPAALKYWNRVQAPLLSGVTFRPETGVDPAYRSRLFAFSGGQVFTSARWQTTQANLLRANIFSNVRIDLLARPGKQYEAIVDVQPKALPLSGWLGKLLPLARDLPYQGVDLDLFNIRGRGTNFNSLWRWDPDKRRIRLDWRAPVHGNPRNQYLFWADARDEVWDLRRTYTNGTNGVAIRSAAAGASYITGITPKLQWTVGTTAARHTFGSNRPDTSFLFTNAWTATLDDRLDYQLWSLPEHRLSTSAWGLFNVGRTFAAPDTSSRLAEVRGGFNAEWFPQAKGETYRLTIQTQAGRLFGNTPIDDLFQLGMERDTARGLWLRGIVSTQNGRKGSALLGREYAIQQTTLERQFFHIPFVTFAAGPFFDAAWVSDPNVNFALRGGTCAVGLQATVRTIGGVALTVAYGRDLQSGRGAFYTATSR